jgi:uncharacterized protein (TIRG00374 family)
MSESSGQPSDKQVEATHPASEGIRISRRQWISGAITLAIVFGVLAYFLPQFADMEAVWASITAMTSLEIATLVAAAAWNLITYLFVIVPSMPGLRPGQAFVATQSSTAVANTLPAGSALGVAVTFAMYDSWGFSRSRSTVSMSVSGIWNNFAKLGLPVIALALVALQGGASTGRVIAAVLGVVALVVSIAVFALLLRSDAWAHRVGEGLGRAASRALRVLKRDPVEGWGRAVAKFRSRTILLVRARWHWLTLGTLASQLSLFFVLLLALRHVGVSQSEIAWQEVLAVFAFARLLTAIPITPGGVGVVDVALIAGLAAAGGSRDEVTAAVLVYRLLTYVLPIPLGVLTYLFWRGHRSWRRPPNSAPRTPLVPESA